MKNDDTSSFLSVSVLLCTEDTVTRIAQSWKDVVLFVQALIE
jgi:hypothetical protein